MTVHNLLFAILALLPALAVVFFLSWLVMRLLRIGRTVESMERRLRAIESLLRQDDGPRV
jgi:flagellar biogenesis protein FliO